MRPAPLYVGVENNELRLKKKHPPMIELIRCLSTLTRDATRRLASLLWSAPGDYTHPHSLRFVGGGGGGGGVQLSITLLTLPSLLVFPRRFPKNATRLEPRRGVLNQGNET